MPFYLEHLEKAVSLNMKNMDGKHPGAAGGHARSSNLFHLQDPTHLIFRGIRVTELALV